MLVALGAVRRAERHVRGLDGRRLLRDLISSRGARFRERVTAVLGGHHLAEAGLEQVLEPELYAWVGRLRSQEVEQGLREAAAIALEEPEGADLAGRYLAISPPSFRRALGEHYTPAWLVDLVLERIPYDPTRDTLLDPTCGAGAFLSGALARIRIDPVEEIVRRVRGIELNPLAVSLSRLAYLDGLGPDRCAQLAARDLRVPVVLGDALFGPRSAVTPDSPGGEWKDTEPVSLLAGNPPWVSWERLSVAYREGLRDQRSELCEALFPHRGLRARSGGAHDDLSALVTYGVADGFLTPGGRLGFVLPVSLFRSRRGGQGFRSLRLGDRFELQVRSVDDLTELRPFAGAAGRAAVLVASRRAAAQGAATQGAATRFPVAWTRWSAGGRRPGASEELAAVRSRWRTEDLSAEPVTRSETTSPWLVATRAELAPLRRMAGPSPYRARKGVDTSLNAVFWVEVLERGSDLWRVRNAQTRSRSPVEPTEALLEPDALYPLLRGRDFARWTATGQFHQVLLYDPATGRPLPDDRAQERFPRAHAYLHGYASALLRRGIYRKHLQGAPAYACYDIGPYSFAPTKVVWKALAAGIQACVVHSADERPIVPDHNVVLVALADPDEAHFLCGVLNSAQVTRFADAYTGWFYSTHLLQTLAVPQYNPGSETHLRIAALSRAAHAEPSPLGSSGPQTRQARLNRLVGGLEGFSTVLHEDIS